MTSVVLLDYYFVPAVGSDLPCMCLSYALISVQCLFKQGGSYNGTVLPVAQRFEDVFNYWLISLIPDCFLVVARPSIS